VAKILQFTILNYNTPFWLHNLPEASCGLNTFDKSILTIFVDYDLYRDEFKLGMLYIQHKLKATNTPIIRKLIINSCNKLSKLGYINEYETEYGYIVLWTGLVPWIPKSKIKEFREIAKRGILSCPPYYQSLEKEIQNHMFPYNAKMKLPPKLPSPGGKYSGKYSNSPKNSRD
jgi:hypothetical protein